MTPKEQALANELFSQGDQKKQSAMDKFKEEVLSVAPGLRDLLSESKEKLKELGSRGSHELANALFNGHAFVLYGQGNSKDDNGHDVSEISAPGPTPPEPTQENERGGRSM